MVIEIAGVIIVTPSYGTTLYAWAIVLSITLLALSSGYYLGGILSKNKFKIHPVTIIFFVGIMITSIPFISETILYLSLKLSYIPGLVGALLIFIFPTMLLLGTLSPILINELDSYLDNPGYTSGKIFAISTLGGILGSLLFVFYFLPTVGITRTIFMLGIFLILVAICFFIIVRKKYFLLLGLLLMIPVIMNVIEATKTDSYIKVLYNSDGVQGQVKVVETHFKNASGKIQRLRLLLVNNTIQGSINPDDLSKSFLQYVSLLNPVLRSQYKGGDVLILGLGAGLVCNAFQEYEYSNIDAVEIDARIEEVARKFFYLERDINIIIDDARHFISTSDKRYEIIIIDTFCGESIPGHMLTIEALQQIKRLLELNGLVVINFHGYLHGQNGYGARSVLKTLSEVGFETIVCATDREDGIKRSLLFFSAAVLPKDLIEVIVPKTTNIGETDSTILKDFNIPINTIDLAQAEILTDEFQNLNIILLDIELEWRRFTRETLLAQFKKAKISLIN